MGEQNKPQEGTALNAEHLWGLNSRLIPASESECVPHDDIIAMEHDEFISCVEQYAAQETAALREELEVEREKHGLTLLSWRQDNDSRCAKINDLEKELEAVKKERDIFGQNVEMFRQEVKKRTDFADWVTRQRDEAVKLLGDSYFDFNNMPSKWNEKREELLSRISSGDTKPVSPFISVEERLPEPYVEVYAGSFDDDGDFGQTICWHTGDAWEGIEITVDTMITHWAEKLPAPTESLTDKKPKVKHDWIGRTNYCSRCGEYQTKYNKEDYCLTDKSKI